MGMADHSGNCALGGILSFNKLRAPSPLGTSVRRALKHLGTLGTWILKVFYLADMEDTNRFRYIHTLVKAHTLHDVSAFIRHKALGAVCNMI